MVLTAEHDRSDASDCDQARKDGANAKAKPAGRDRGIAGDGRCFGNNRCNCRINDRKNATLTGSLTFSGSGRTCGAGGRANGGLRLDRAVSAKRNERAHRHGCERDWNASRRGDRGTEAQCETGKCADYRLYKLDHDGTPLS
jgi:hypothetical protein